MTWSPAPDVLVVGGGPVGLATALYAARAGLDVTVWEPRTGVIDKACGEGLMPAAVAALEELGVDPEGIPLEGIAYLDSHRRVRAAFRGGHGRGVRRTTLHAALREAAQDRGVRVVSRRVEALRQEADHVVVNDELRFGSVLAADGLHSTTRRVARLQGRASALRRYGLRAHLRVEPWTSDVEVHWASGVEAYVTPVGPELVGVALLTTTRTPFLQQVGAFPALSRHIQGALVGRVLGAGPLLQRSRRRVEGRLLLVGDAAGYVDALTGEGIALGLATGRAAVAAVAAGDHASYERSWRRLTREHRLLTHALLAASQTPVLRAAVVPSAAAMPRVFGAAVNLLAGSGSQARPVTS